MRSTASVTGLDVSQQNAHARYGNDDHRKQKTGLFKLMSNAARRQSITVKQWRKNWWPLTLYGYLAVSCIASSYFTSGALSVVASLIVAVVMFFVALFMLSREITTTNEER